MRVEDIQFWVHWSEDDQDWVAVCNAFRSLSWLSEAPERALSGLIILIDDIIREEPATAFDRQGCFDWEE